MRSRVLCLSLFGFSSLSLAAGLSLPGASHSGLKVSNSADFLECANFEGNWQGTCLVEGTLEPALLGLNQSTCTSLDYQGLNTTFGQDLTYFQDETSRYTHRFDWNNSYKVIQRSVNLEAKNAADPNTSFKTVATIKGTLEIVNDELIYKISRTDYSNEDGSPSTTEMPCSYKKL